MTPTSLLAFIFTFFTLFTPFNQFVSADTECPIVSSFGDRRQNKNSLRLVQYNVEWLFIDYNSNSKCPGTGCPWTTVDDAKIHLSYVADAIKSLNPDIINVNGGAISLGHPLGCSGAKLSVQIFNELKRQNKKYGMVSMCVGTGQGAAGIFEML